MKTNFTIVHFLKIFLHYIFLIYFILIITGSILIDLSKFNQNFGNNSENEMQFVTLLEPAINEQKYYTLLAAIYSWLSVSENTSIIFFIDNNTSKLNQTIIHNIESRFGQNRMSFSFLSKTHITNIPYFSDWIIEGLQSSNSKLISFINNDIIITKRWYEIMTTLSKIFITNKIFCVGERLNFDVDNYTDFGRLFQMEDYLKNIEKYIYKHNITTYTIFGMDTFTFSNENHYFNPLKIPNFLKGRYRYDNWFTGLFLSIAETVSFGHEIPVFHLNHKKNALSTQNLAIEYNTLLTVINCNFYGFNLNTKWYISKNYLLSRNLKNQFSI